MQPLMSTAAKLECVSCRLPKAQNRCGLCDAPVCRGCEQLVPEDRFSFLPEVSDRLKKIRYCQPCHQAEIEPIQAEYEATIELAKQVFFFSVDYRGHLPLLKKHKESISVDKCQDKDETTLRLGFLAARLGFNSIIDGKIECEKVRQGAYQTSNWKGRGVPAQLDEEKLNRRG